MLREAENTSAPIKYNEQVIALQAFNTQAGKMDIEVRSFTLLFYPRPEHIQNFVYATPDDVKSSWELVLPTIPYRHAVYTDYPASMSVDLKVQKMVASIQAVGRSRDDAWRKMYPYDKRMKEIGEEQKEINTQIATISPQLDFGKYVCFYKKRPRRGQNFECKTKKDSEFRRKKRARNCDTLTTFTFTYETPEEEEEYQSAISECLAGC